MLGDSALSNTGDDDRGERRGSALVAYDAANASALTSTPALGKASTGYQGVSDGWTDLRDDHRMDWTYDSAAQPGNVVQTAATPLTISARCSVRAASPGPPGWPASTTPR